MAGERLVAHSLAETYLYLMVTPCADCSKGPLNGSDAVTATGESSAFRVEIDVTCGQCDWQSRFSFRLPHGTGVEQGKGLPTLNPTDDPSGIIDAGQWLTLFRVITAKAAETSDKADARLLGLEAAQCLEEALKFYEQDNDLPPPGSCFVESSRRRLADHPQEFSRQRLLDLRAKLPNLSLMRARARQDARPAKRRWWQRR